MAYLKGHQDHFTMVGAQESARSGLPMSGLPMFRFANVQIDSAGLELILPSRNGTYIINRVRGDLGFRPI
ncbi:DUF993 family protein [Bradyrhizobium sp. 164]|uniref:DUF993 family protein n=1 Tax=Bradyrhizobium sp. 164 TaxID=2782637 RepID=UPI001FF9B3E8|nr:DUF993 family protein [Bradyrhizobium sp. 164]